MVRFAANATLPPLARALLAQRVGRSKYERGNSTGPVKTRQRGGYRCRVDRGYVSMSKRNNASVNRRRRTKNYRSKMSAWRDNATGRLSAKTGAFLVLPARRIVDSVALLPPRLPIVTDRLGIWRVPATLLLFGFCAGSETSRIF
jgi:hypothetical protein